MKIAFNRSTGHRSRNYGCPTRAREITLANLGYGPRILPSAVRLSLFRECRRMRALGSSGSAVSRKPGNDISPPSDQEMPFQQRARWIKSNFAVGG